jgi:SMC interacting uncharacterized protein involved in chromosome segregation
MKEVESILEPISGCLSSITRNTVNGWYELEIGIPKNWVFTENDEIGIEVVSEIDEGKLLKIFPKNVEIVIDDLINFVNIVVNTNKKIAKKEEEFKAQMEEMKKGLEQKASDFFKELDELKENSFKKLNDNFIDGLNQTKKERKKRTLKSNNVSGDTETNNPPAIKIDTSRSA